MALPLAVDRVFALPQPRRVAAAASAAASASAAAASAAASAVAAAAAAAVVEILPHLARPREHPGSRETT